MTKQKLIIKKENSFNKNKSFNKFRNNVKIPYSYLDNNTFNTPYLLGKIKLNQNPKKLKTLKNPLKLYINYNLNKRKLFHFSKKLAKNSKENILIPEKFIKILNKNTIIKPKFKNVKSQVNIHCNSKMKNSNSKIQKYDSKVQKRKYSLNNIFDMISYYIENSTNKIRVNTIIHRNNTDINLQLNKGKEFFISAKGYEEEDDEGKNNIHLKLQNILGYESEKDEKISSYLKSKENNKKNTGIKKLYRPCSSEYNINEKNFKNSSKYNNWKKKPKTQSMYYCNK